MNSSLSSTTIFGLLGISFFLLGCVNNSDFDRRQLLCIDENISNSTIEQVINLYVDQTIQIQEDLIIEGYVVSSDKAGNFFNVLYFQDSPTNPNAGLILEFELRDSHLFFGIGQHIFINLKGLYLGKTRGVFKIGGVFTSFGNRSVGRLPNNVIFDHLSISCETSSVVVPNLVSVLDFNETMVNTLVSIENLEFVDEEIGQPFAELELETKRNLVDCDDNELVLLNSGYSDFQAETLPDGRGTLTGILSLEGNEFQLIIRDTEDIVFDQERCAELIDEFTSRAVFISELADPDNNAGARFVEIYNSSSESLSLKGWSLVRYTNDNTEVSSTIDLSDFSIGGEGFLVISPNADEFELVYGFMPDIAVGTNSPADSNGDDNLVLVDPFGSIIDIFGIVGEDGSGTAHEFEDGRAVRNLDIVEGNIIFTANEWLIYNDTGSNGTINLPQNAPADYNPGSR